MDNDFSRRAHAGEQNIRENHCISREGTIVHSVKVSDGNLVPSCTQEALREHVGELKTASDGKFLMEVHFDRPCDETSKSLYKNFERSINAELQTEKNQNIKVKIIWDHE